MLRGELMELDLPEAGTNGPVDLGGVVAERRRREVEAFALLKPAVEGLADRDAHAVGAAGGLTVHEVPESSIGCPCAAVERL